MRKLLLILPLLLLVGLTYLSLHLGYFKKVEIIEGTRGPLKMIYKEHIGPYHKIVPVIEEVEKWTKSVGESCTESFGRYLDNPEVVEEARLKSQGGCIVNQIPTSLPDSFRSLELPEQRFVQVEFSGSPAIGPLRVYPKVKEYIAEHKLELNGAVIEIYVIHSQTEMTTTYLFPIKN